MTTNDLDCRSTMCTDESLLEEMLDHATNPNRETADELSVQMFCMEVRKDSRLIFSALELIVAKIRDSSNVMEAIRAIALLEECMSKCGSDFQNEVAKYKFLNDLIRLVSIKYKGAQTPSVIKQRIMKCLLLWTVEFPQKTKIRDAYDMLSKEEGVSDGRDHVQVAAAAVKKPESALGIDEKKFVELIHSSDPENFKRANLLVQYRFGQEARTTELALQHRSKLVEVETTVGLLNQMLDSYEAEGSNDSEDTVNLIRDLYLSCKKHKPVLQRLPELVEMDNDLTLDTMETNKSLINVLKRYKQTIVHPPKSRRSDNSNSAKYADLLTGDLTSDTPTVNATTADLCLSLSSVADPFAELSTTFRNDCFVDTSKKTDELLNSIDLLSNVPSEAATANAVSKQTQRTDSSPEAKKSAFKELREIDQLSEALLKSSLPTVDRIGSFKRDPERMTLNDLAKRKVNSSLVTSVPLKVPNTAEITNVPCTNKLHVDTKPKDRLLEQQDVAMLSNSPEIVPSIATDVLNNVSILAENLLLPSKSATNVEASTGTAELKEPVKHLADIEICLDAVVPTSEQVILLDDDDIHVTLNFTENRPTKEVSVMVISILNKSKLQVHDLQFEASVKKPSKVRLLPPTDVSMAPSKPFRPPTPINQVMLLSNPTGKAVDITCIVGYKLGDDPDAIKESFLAKGIPYIN